MTISNTYIIENVFIHYILTSHIYELTPFNIIYAIGNSDINLNHLVYVTVRMCYLGWSLTEGCLTPPIPSIKSERLYRI